MTEHMNLEPTPARTRSRARRAVFSSQIADAAALFQPDVNLFVHTRANAEALASAACRLADSGFASRQFVIEPGRTGVAAIADELHGEQALARDLLEIAEQVADLTGARVVGARVVAPKRAMCPKFHADFVLVRAVVAYAGSGPEWLDEADVIRDRLAKPNVSAARTGASARQVAQGAVAFMKGERWPDNERGGLVHRSPAFAPGRLIATLDPLELDEPSG